MRMMEKNKTGRKGRDWERERERGGGRGRG